MSVLVLSAADVAAVLDMPSCIERMGEVLREASAGTVHNPLRMVVRPPDGPTFLGLMPSYRGGADPVYGVKEVVIAPANHTRGLDAHQGAVLVHDGVTGELRGVVNASTITAIRTAAVSAVATAALARGGARRVAILGAGVQARWHVEAMRVVVPDATVVVWSRTPANAARLAAAAGCEVAESVAAALDGADVVCTTTSSVDPIVERSSVRHGLHINAVGSSIATARELDAATVAAASLFVDRRESTVNESGDYLGAVREAGIGPDHIRAEVGEVLAGDHPGRTSDTEITVFKSLGLAVEDLAAAQLCLERARAERRGTEARW